MGDALFLVNRIREHRGLLAGWCAVIAIVTAALVAVSTTLAGGSAAGLRAALTASPDAALLQLRTGLADDERRQDAAAAALFGRAFGSLPVTVHRALTGGHVAVTAARTRPPLAGGAALELRSVQQVPAHAALVAGAWPADGAATGVVKLSMPVQTAAATGLAVGDTVHLFGSEGTLAQVSAVFQPDAELAADLQPLTTDGAPATDLVAVVADAELRRLVSSPSVLWTIAADPAAIQPSQVDPMGEAAAGIRRLANNDAAVNVQGVHEYGSLSTTLATVSTSLAAVRGIATVPLLLIGSFGVVLLGQLSALVARARRPEVALLRSRGVPVLVVTGWQIIEAAVLAVPVALVGFFGWRLLGGATADGGPVSSTPWWPVLLVPAFCVVTTAILVLRDGLRQRVAGSRLAGVVSAAPAVLIVAAAGVSLWRFRRLGSAIVTGGSGGTSLDAVAAPAPALLLVASAVVAAVAAGGVAAVVARLVAAQRGIDAVLPSRQVSRRWPVFGAVTLLVCLAVAGLTLASGYDRTHADFARTSAVLTNGADVTVDLSADRPADSAVDPAAAFRSLAGVAVASGVLVTPVDIGSTSAELVAAPAADLPRLTPDVDGGYHPSAVGAALAGRPVGIAVPAGTQRITADVEATAFLRPSDSAGGPPPDTAPVGLHVVLWLATADGPVLALRSADTAVPVSLGDGRRVLDQRLQLSLPAGSTRGPATVVAIDTVLDTGGSETVDSVRITGVSTDGTAADFPAGQTWIAPPVDDGADQLSLVTGAAGSVAWGGRIPAAEQGLIVRLMPATVDRGGAIRVGAGAPVNAVLDQPLAARLGALPGATVDLRLSGTDQQVQVVVVAVSTVLPGATGTLRAVVDLGAVQAQLLSTVPAPPAVDQVRLALAVATASAAVAGSAGGGGRVVTVAGGGAVAALIQPAGAALWTGAVAAALLAVLAVATAAAGQDQERRGEPVALRALGLTRRQYLRTRRRELGCCVAGGALLGLAAGLFATWLTAGELARSAVVGASPLLRPPVALSPVLWWALAAGALGVVTVLVCFDRRNSAHWAVTSR